MPEYYMITGRLRDEGNRPAARFSVQAFDKKHGLFFFHPDVRLGKALSGDDGRFEIPFSRETFGGLLEVNPEIYLTVRDPAGKLVLQTGWKSNKTGHVDFQVKLGDREVDPLAPDIYQDGMRRIVSSLRASTGAVNMSRSDVSEMAEILLRAVDSWSLYRDRLFRVAGYDGIQVPSQPRREKHNHVTRWDRPALKS